MEISTQDLVVIPVDTTPTKKNQPCCPHTKKLLAALLSAQYLKKSVYSLWFYFSYGRLDQLRKKRKTRDKRKKIGTIHEP